MKEIIVYKVTDLDTKNESYVTKAGVNVLLQNYKGKVEVSTEEYVYKEIRKSDGSGMEKVLIERNKKDVSLKIKKENG